MATPYLEHVNITVGSPERMAGLLEALFGWRIRWQGAAAAGGHTIHVGSETHYIALYAPPGSEGAPRSFAKGHPLNHVSVVVDDLDALEAKVVAAGLKPFSHGDYEPGRRFYFFTEDGIEFEIVSYA